MCFVLATYLPLLLGIVSVSDNGNGGNSVFQFFPLFGRKCKFQCAQVLLQMCKFRCSGNRYDPRCLLEQPAECYLCRGHASRAAEGLQHIHDAGIRPHCFRLEARQGLSVVVVWVENRIFVDAAAQKSTIQRLYGTKPIPSSRQASSTPFSSTRRCIR